MRSHINPRLLWLVLPWLMTACHGTPTERSDAKKAPWDNLLQTPANWSLQCHPNDRTKPFFSWKDGVLICDTHGDHNHGMMFYEAPGTYADFELELEFQGSSERSGNSGLQIRSRWDPEANRVDGPQIDIHPPAPWRIGRIYDETRTANRWICPSRPNWQLDPLPVPEGWRFHDAAGEPEAWNTLRVVAEGLQIKTFLNGVPIVDFCGVGILDDSGHQAQHVGRNGKILIQLHAKDDLLLRVRALRVRPLR